MIFSSKVKLAANIITSLSRSCNGWFLTSSRKHRVVVCAVQENLKASVVLTLGQSASSRVFVEKHWEYRNTHCRPRQMLSTLPADRPREKAKSPESPRLQPTFPPTHRTLSEKMDIWWAGMAVCCPVVMILRIDPPHCSWWYGSTNLFLELMFVFSNHKKKKKKGGGRWIIWFGSFCV